MHHIFADKTTGEEASQTTTILQLVTTEYLHVKGVTTPACIKQLCNNHDLVTTEHL